jgi:hypothetical protein
MTERRATQSEMLGGFVDGGPMARGGANSGSAAVSGIAGSRSIAVQVASENRWPYKSIVIVAHALGRALGGRSRASP